MGGTSGSGSPRAAVLLSGRMLRVKPAVLAAWSHSSTSQPCKTEALPLYPRVDASSQGCPRTPAGMGSSHVGRAPSGSWRTARASLPFSWGDCFAAAVPLVQRYLPSPAMPADGDIGSPIRRQGGERLPAAPARWERGLFTLFTLFPSNRLQTAPSRRAPGPRRVTSAVFCALVLLSSPGRA